MLKDEDLTAESFEQLLSDLRAGKEVEPGPQNGRQFSAPEGGPTTLLNGAANGKSKNSGTKRKASTAAKKGTTKRGGK